MAEVAISHISIISRDQVATPLLDCDSSRVGVNLHLSLQTALTQSLTHREYNKCYLNKRKMSSKARGPVAQHSFLLQTRLQSEAFFLFCFHNGLLLDGGRLVPRLGSHTRLDFNLQ